MAERPEPRLFERLKAIHHALDAAGYPHAVGGALALGFHTQDPRFTSDIDLNVVADAAHPEPLLDCLPEAIVIPPEAADAIRENGQVRLIWPDPDHPIDLFLPQHPTFHALVDERSEVWRLGDERLRVISATDLTIFKVLFNRPHDWADIASLVATGKVDVDEAQRWLEEFLGTSDSRLRRLADIATHPATEPSSFRDAIGSDRVTE